MSDKDIPVTWLTRYDEVRAAFKNPALLQASYDGAKDTVFADVLVTLDGAEHGRRRRAEAVLLRTRVVSRLESEVVPGDARRLIAGFVASGAADLVDLSRLVSTALAARVVGLDDCDDPGRLDELSELMATLHEGAVIDWATRPREEVLERVRVARERYRESFFEPSLARRRQALESPPHADAAGHTESAGDRSRDLLELLVAEGDGLGMDEPMMLRESVHYLVATAHTSATVLVHVMDEIWRWVASHPEERALVSDPDFVQACVAEAMRLWPPSGFQLRVAASDLVLESGRSIRSGERIGLDLVEANRDPEVFGPNALGFDPHRRTSKQVAGYGLAFGDGAHVCIGKRLAAGAASAAGGSGAHGVVAAIAIALLEAGCRPDPASEPELQQGTVRHQYRRYPVLFST